LERAGRILAALFINHPNTYSYRLLLPARISQDSYLGEPMDANYYKIVMFGKNFFQGSTACRSSHPWFAVEPDLQAQQF
jgi:hypothetical protein